MVMWLRLMPGVQPALDIHGYSEFRFLFGSFVTGKSGWFQIGNQPNSRVGAGGFEKMCETSLFHLLKEHGVVVVLDGLHADG